METYFYTYMRERKCMRVCVRARAHCLVFSRRVCLSPSSAILEVEVLLGFLFGCHF